MNHLAFNVPEEKFDEYRQRLKAKGSSSGRCSTTTWSPSQVSAKLYPGVYVRSFYFADPDGIVLEFACWTKEFTAEPKAKPKTAADRKPRVPATH